MCRCVCVCYSLLDAVCAYIKMYKIVTYAKTSCLEIKSFNFRWCMCVCVCVGSVCCACGLVQEQATGCTHTGGLPTQTSRPHMYTPFLTHAVSVSLCLSLSLSLSLSPFFSFVYFFFSSRALSCTYAHLERFSHDCAAGAFSHDMCCAVCRRVD